jgi:hypothetical protein
MIKEIIDIPEDGMMEIRKMAELYVLYPEAQNMKK